MGDSPKLVAALFEAAAYYAPSIVFIDEVRPAQAHRPPSRPLIC